MPSSSWPGADLHGRDHAVHVVRSSLASVA